MAIQAQTTAVIRTPIRTEATTDTIDTRIAALRATVIRRASWRGLPWRLWRAVRATWTA